MPRTRRRRARRARANPAYIAGSTGSRRSSFIGPLSPTQQAEFNKRSRAAKKGVRRRRKAKRARRRTYARRRRSPRRRRSAARRRRSPRRRRSRRSYSRRRRSPRRRRSRRRWSGGSSKGVRKLASARGYIKKARRGGYGKRARRYTRYYRMRTNPSFGALPGTLIATVQVALPVAISLYLSRVIATQVGMRFSSQLGSLGRGARPAVAAGTVLAAHFATMSGPLAKYRVGIMVGTGINLIDSLVATFAPANVSAKFGLSDYEVYDEALSDYYSDNGGEYDNGEGLGEYEGGGALMDGGGDFSDADLNSGGAALYTGVFARQG